MACSLPLTHLRFSLPVQMLNENIRVASLITDSLQQKVYNMALEELEAFLGRSVEPLAPCSSSQTLGPMAKHRRLMVEICHREPCAHPGPRRHSTLSMYVATVSALGAISSQGLLPQVSLQSRRALLSRGVCNGPHYPPLPNNLSLSKPGGRTWKEPSELGGLWDVHVPPGASQLQVLRRDVWGSAHTS